MDSIPTDHIISASGWAETNREDKSSMEGNLQECHHFITIGTYGQKCSATVTRIAYITIICRLSASFETILDAICA